MLKIKYSLVFFFLLSWISPCRKEISKNSINTLNNHLDLTIARLNPNNKRTKISQIFESKKKTTLKQVFKIELLKSKNITYIGIISKFENNDYYNVKTYITSNSLKEINSLLKLSLNKKESIENINCHDIKEEFFNKYEKNYLGKKIVKKLNKVSFSGLIPYENFGYQTQQHYNNRNNLYNMFHNKNLNNNEIYNNNSNINYNKNTIYNNNLNKNYNSTSNYSSPNIIIYPRTHFYEKNNLKNYNTNTLPVNYLIPNFYNYDNLSYKKNFKNLYPKENSISNKNLVFHRDKGHKHTYLPNHNTLNSNSFNNFLKNYNLKKDFDNYNNQIKNYNSVTTFKNKPLLNFQNYLKNSNFDGYLENFGLEINKNDIKSIIPEQYTFANQKNSQVDFTKYNKKKNLNTDNFVIFNKPNKKKNFLINKKSITSDPSYNYFNNEKNNKKVLKTGIKKNKITNEDQLINNLKNNRLDIEKKIVNNVIYPKNLYKIKMNVEKKLNQKLVNQRIKNEKKANQDLYNIRMNVEKKLNQKLVNQRIKNEKKVNQDLYKIKMNIEKKLNQKLVNQRIKNENSINKKVFQNRLINEQTLNQKIYDERLKNERFINEKILKERIKNENYKNKIERKNILNVSNFIKKENDQNLKKLSSQIDILVDNNKKIHDPILLKQQRQILTGLNVIYDKTKLISENQISSGNLEKQMRNLIEIVENQEKNKKNINNSSNEFLLNKIDVQQKLISDQQKLNEKILNRKYNEIFQKKKRKF